jgi:hypothetical protein
LSALESAADTASPSLQRRINHTITGIIDALRPDPQVPDPPVVASSDEESPSEDDDPL